MIDLDYLKNNHQKIHYFGLGFIQIKIRNKNYHFYTNKWEKVEDDIHTHKYSFKSKILKGSLNKKIYKEIPRIEYNKTLCDCKEGSKNDFIKQTNLKEIISLNIVPGSEYIIDKDTIHKVTSNFCITVVEKDKIINKKAVVYKPRDLKENICPFFKVEEVELWKEVERMINE